MGTIRFAIYLLMSAGDFERVPTIRASTEAEFRFPQVVDVNGGNDRRDHIPCFYNGGILRVFPPKLNWHGGGIVSNMMS